jgi:Zn-dependent protease with chaperone function
MVRSLDPLSRLNQWLADRLAQLDPLLLRITNTAWGRLLWGLYILVIVLLAALFYVPVIAGFFLFAWLTLDSLISRNVIGTAISGLFLAAFGWYLFHRREPDPTLIPKTHGDMPLLFSAIAEVADQVHTRLPDVVCLALGTDMHVSEEIDWRRSWRPRRILVIGMAGLMALSVSELKAILAHEMAHFRGRDTILSRFVSYTEESIAKVMYGFLNIHQARLGGIVGLLAMLFGLIVGGVLLIFVTLFHIIATFYSRRSEYQADCLAAQCYGSDTFTSALQKYAMVCHSFNQDFVVMIGRMISGLEPSNIYLTFSKRISYQPATQPMSRPVSLPWAARRLTDRHPLLTDRLQAVEVSPRSDSKDTRPATALLGDPEQVGAELTQHWLTHRPRWFSYYLQAAGYY